MRSSVFPSLDTALIVLIVLMLVVPLAVGLFGKLSG
jgi:hypothetical protein